MVSVDFKHHVYCTNRQERVDNWSKGPEILHLYPVHLIDEVGHQQNVAQAGGIKVAHQDVTDQLHHLQQNTTQFTADFAYF